MIGKLILVATPIGNLEDISFRAVKQLKDCDFIAAEDTRVTIKFLNYLNIKKPLVSYHEHNMHSKSKQIIERIMDGETCVLVTDAGMPAISDPGEQIVKLCYDNNIEVSIIPGACAAVCALAVSGLDTASFVFEGFLSVNKKKRMIKLEELKTEKRTIILYEAPHKIIKTLNDIYEVFGERKISLVRELTKIYEEIIKTTLSEAALLYSEERKPKGEFVLVVEGNKTYGQNRYDLNQAVDMVKDLIDNGKTLIDASKKVSEMTGIRKRLIYNEALRL